MKRKLTSELQYLNSLLLSPKDSQMVSNPIILNRAILPLLVTIMACAECSSAQLSTAETKEGTEGKKVANEFSLDKGKIRFVAPNGFETLSKRIIATKWPSNRAPKFAVGNAKASTTIAYDIKPNPITDDKLPELLKTFEGLFPRLIPGLEWKKKEVRKIKNRKWIHIEMTSSAADTDIYNIMLVTPYKEQMLMFNFNSTREEFPKLEKELRASIDSIEINEEIDSQEVPNSNGQETPHESCPQESRR